MFRYFGSKAGLFRVALVEPFVEYNHHELATRSMLAMVAGMAVFGKAFYGKRPPSRNAIVEELTQAVLYGRVYREH